jgi:hypothetical protein
MTNLLNFVCFFRKGKSGSGSENARFGKNPRAETKLLRIGFQYVSSIWIAIIKRSSLQKEAAIVDIKMYKYPPGTTETFLNKTE